MSPKANSTALAIILALGASPLMAQTATEVPPADAAADAAAAAATAADQAVEAAEGAAEATADTAAAAADAAAEAASEAAAAANSAAAAAANSAAAAATEAAQTPAADAAPETPAAEAPAAEAPAADAPAANAPAADAAPAAPLVGAYYPRSTHGDWTLRCIKTEDGADPCELYQLMKDGAGNSVAEITLIPLENGGEAKAGATIVTPLETDLTQGIRLQIDAGKPKAYPFNFCAPVGCVSRVGLTEAELGSLKRGKAASVSLLPYGAGADQIVNLSLSLTGFTAGYTELEAAVAELRASVEAAKAAAPAETPATDAPAAPEAAPAQ